MQQAVRQFQFLYGYSYNVAKNGTFCTVHLAFGILSVIVMVYHIGYSKTFAWLSRLYVLQHLNSSFKHDQHKLC